MEDGCGRDEGMKPDFEVTELIRSATDFISDLQRMGYGDQTRPLPTSYDDFVDALEAARDKLTDRALDQDTEE